MTVFIVVPVCAIFYILKKEATKRDWTIVCGFFIVSLLMSFIFSYGLGSTLFKLFIALLMLILVILLYKKINWPQHNADIECLSLRTC